MNILHKPIVHKVNTILLPIESYTYLREEMHRQRSETGRPLSEKTYARIKRKFESIKGGYEQVNDYAFGGCNGDPHNAWEEHRWTNWSTETMKRMLDEKGLPDKDGKPEEKISL